MLGLGGAIPAAVWEKAAVFSRRRGAVRTRKEARSEKTPGGAHVFAIKAECMV